MEPILLITTALSLATPYLIKSGESIAEKIGEDIWTAIKKPFSKEKKFQKLPNINNEDDKNNLISLMLNKINEEKTYKVELEEAVKYGQNELNAHNQQNIKNSGKIKNQINIQNNNGSIKL